MDDHTTITTAIAHYEHIDRLSSEIEQAVLKRHFEAVPSLRIRLEQVQDAAKACDSEILALLRQRKEYRKETAVEKLVGLMQRIATRNRLLLPQINSIMAVQRNELQTLHKGNSALQGYRPSPAQTGGRLSSAG